MRDKTVTIQLLVPAQLADREITEITMRRPKVKDYVRHGGTNSSYTIKDESNFIADLCGLTPEDLGEIDYADFENLQTQLLRFREKTDYKGS